MKTTQSIAFDFAVHGITPRIVGKQGDTGSRYVQISLYDQGAAWPVPEGALLALRYKTPYGASGLYDTIDDTPAITYTGNTVTALLAPPIFAAPGAATCELVITDKDGGISTWSFFAEIEAASDGGTEVPEDYYNAFLGVAAQAAEAVAEAEAQAARAEAAASSIDTSNLCSKTMYDPDGAVETAGGIPKYVAANAPQGDFIPISQKAAANGVAPLDSNKKVTTTYLPISSSTSSTSTTLVATASAVKAAYDKAAAATLTVTTGINNTVETAAADTSHTATLDFVPVKYGRLVFVNCIFTINSGIGDTFAFDSALSSYKPAIFFATYAGPCYQTKGTFNNHYNAEVETDGTVTMRVASIDGGTYDSASFRPIKFALCYISAS